MITTYNRPIESHKQKSTFQINKATNNKTMVMKLKRVVAIIGSAESCAILINIILALNIFITVSNAHSLGDNSNHGQDSNLHQLQQQQHHGGRHQSGKLLQAAQNQHNGNQNRCQSGWMWFNNKCWVTSQSRRDFSHAVELCKNAYNSTLPTIHSEDENEFLRQNIDLHNSPIWLYARHNHQYNKTRWLDKSIVNYTNWDAGQPSDKSSLVCIKTEESWYMKKAEAVNGQTECVSFWEDAKWGTQVGCLVLLPVVCEKKLTPISRSSDGPNGTITSLSEQQLLSVSSANSFNNNSNNLISFCCLIYMLTSLYVYSNTILNRKMQTKGAY